MKKARMQGIANLVKDILGNVAVVGIGLALYEQKWWCLIVAVFAVIIAVAIVWRSYDD